MFARALFVGINRYRPQEPSFNDLGGCVADMLLARETLATVLGGLPDRTVTLVDGEATTQRLLDELAALVDGLRPGEHVLLCHAGHGGQVPNVNRTADDAEAYDQMLVPHDFSKTRPLLDDILHCFIARVPQQARLTMILDTCHSGGMSRAPMSTAEMAEYQREGWQSRSVGTIARGAYSPAELTALREHKERYLVEQAGESFTLLAAAQPDELAWECAFGEKRHGLFTFHLCEALRKNGPRATPVQLVDYAYAQIMTHRENQMPRLVGNESFFQMPLFET